MRFLDPKSGPASRDAGPRLRPGSPSTRGRAVAVVVGLALVGWMLRPLISGSEAGESPGWKTVFVPAPPPPRSVYDTLGPGETLAELMAARGFSGPEIHEVIQVVRGYKSPRTLRPGVVMAFTGFPGQRPDRLSLQLNEDSILHITRDDSAWVAGLDEVPTQLDTLLLSGLIHTSLWFAELGGEVERLGEGEFREYVYDLADVFAWKVDFTRDIRQGDAFRVAIERERRPDGSLRSRRFLALELRNQGRVLPAIPYARPGGRREYFDTEGEALRGVFLRYPVPYRITSGYSNRRYHPILKRYRRHPGTDYGAPRGTPVQATASGTVTRAGMWGGFGRMVEVRHGRGIVTRYAHLSSIARDVRVGARVDQGQTIGRVGATGLATGPHLHYEFLQNGQHRNPSTMDLPSAPALESEYLADFGSQRDVALTLLDGVALPEPSSPVSVAAVAAD